LNSLFDMKKSQQTLLQDEMEEMKEMQSNPL